MDYSNIYKSLKIKIEKILEINFGANKNFEKIAIEIPKNKDHGDLSTNAAMILAKGYQKPPSDIAKIIKSSMLEFDFIDEIDILGPGFINFKFKNNFWSKALDSIIKTEDFGRVNIGHGKKVNIEFVSANPTGPMHVGHARSAIFGDILSRVKSFSGFDVCKEYYLNDAGSQIDTLVESTHMRYRELFGEIINIPEGYYPGEYLIDAAKKIKDQFNDKYLDFNVNNQLEFRNIVLDLMVTLIKSNLDELNISHDVFFSERELHKKDSKFYIQKVIDELDNKNLLYTGKLPKPKGDLEDWDDREQLLFKSTNFADNQDRSLTKSDGSYTYFAADIAYAKSKISRGYNDNIIILGADHVGYVKRLKAAYDSLSNGEANAEILLCQIVNYLESGKQVKMSKRAGSFTTVSDVIDEVGSDVLRFIMVTRKNDALLDFDLEVFKSQSKENPVFYVQYCQVRGLSVLEKAKTENPDIYRRLEIKDYDLSNIISKNEIDLIRTMSLFPNVIEQCAKTNEVHRLANYLYDLSSEFHSFWNFGKENKDFRFIVDGNDDLSISRLAMTKKISEIIRKGLEIMGVTPMDRM